MMNGQNLEEVDSNILGPPYANMTPQQRKSKYGLQWPCLLCQNSTPSGSAETSASKRILSSTEHSLYQASSTDARARL